MSSNGLPAPIAVDLVDELLPVAGGPARVRHHHHVTRRREDLRVPAISPDVAPESLRPAVNQQQHGILAARLEAVRLHHETLHARAILRIHPEFFERRHLVRIQHRVVEMRAEPPARRPTKPRDRSPWAPRRSARCRPWSCRRASTACRPVRCRRSRPGARRRRSTEINWMAWRPRSLVVKNRPVESGDQVKLLTQRSRFSVRLVSLPVARSSTSRRQRSLS